MTWPLALAVGLAAGLGAAARFGIERGHAAARARAGLPPGGFPWSTLAVNAAGSGLLGAVVAAVGAGMLDARWLAVLGAGLCGGFTTFSTLALDVVRLGRERRWRRVAGYTGAQLGCGVAMFALGHALLTT